MFRSDVPCFCSYPLPCTVPHRVKIAREEGSCYAFRMKSIRALIRVIERTETSLGLWLVSFGSLILMRLLVESWLFRFSGLSPAFLFFEWAHNVLFFLLSFLLFLPLFRLFARVSLSEASNVLLFGFLIILSPPIIDFLISHGKGLWSFYIFDGFPGLVSRYFTFFGDRPDMGITYGVRVEVALVSLFFGMYVFLKAKKRDRAFFAMVAAYTLLFVLGTFPSWAAMFIEGIAHGHWLLRGSDVAGVFLSPLSFFSQGFADPRSLLNIKMSLVYASLLPFVVGGSLWLYSRTIFLALLRNARFPQVVYHVGLLLVGMGLAVLFSGASVSFELFDVLAVFLLVVAVVSAWLASVVVNDCFDVAIDTKTNAFRPLPSNTLSPSLYRSIGVGFFVTSLLFSALVFPRAALFLLLYQALATVYSMPPFRLKRFPLVASFVSAVASVLILLLGFSVMAPGGSLTSLPVSFVFFFLFVYTVSIPLKDFKDIAGDAQDGVWTIPVLFGAERAKLLIGSGVCLSFLLSVFVFHTPKLFLPALLCGGASFWMVISMQQKTGSLTYRSIFWWILSCIALYGLWAVWILF